MMQQHTRENPQRIKQYGKLYVYRDNVYCISYPKKKFFRYLFVFAFLGITAVFSDGVPKSASLFLKIIIGSSNLVFIGLIGFVVGLSISSPIALTVAVICELIGLVCACCSANEFVQKDVWGVNLETLEKFSHFYDGDSVQDKIKNGEIRFVQIKEEIASKLKQKGIID